MTLYYSHESMAPIGSLEKLPGLLQTRNITNATEYKYSFIASKDCLLYIHNLDQNDNPNTASSIR